VTASQPVQVLAPIRDARAAGEYRHVTVDAPAIAAGFRPGHFVAVAVGGEHTPLLLRRAFAVYAADPAAGTVEFVIAEHGAGTRWLTARTVGESLDVVGPLGTPFTLPAAPAPVVLVAGGYGSAPLVALAAVAQAAGSPVEMVIGAARAGRLFGVREAERVGATVAVTTEDGSAGHRGRVNDVLPAVLERTGAQRVYACGPMPMLRAVGDLAAARGVVAEVAVEEAMACGIGVCMTCVLPVRGADGRSRFVRSCVDGPVFDAARIRWDDVGRLPADLVGADAMAAH
jgi:dihydroorotate dehydrogenase electron transfer subunit